MVNINEIVAGAFLSAYLGYYGMSEFRGSGMMGEALRATVELAFGELGLHRLEANVQPANTGIPRAAAARRVPQGRVFAALSAD